MSFLIIKTGRTLDRLQHRGDFEDWFTAGLEKKTIVVDVTQGEPLPEVSDVNAVVITGSPAMVSHRLEWSELTANWIRDFHATGKPMLGVCYGHQLIAHALGGQVGPNPHGRQIGTVEVQLDLNGRVRDEIFTDLPESIKVQATHQESVLSVPEGSTVLGSTELDPNHTIHFGGQTWGMQFHPEFDAEVIDAYIRERREDIAAEGLDPDGIASQLSDTRWGPMLLQRFASLVA